ncbi:MAG: High-affinity zinc uptake system binding-protein ZnuA precursor [Syntrophorhabdaceae bacterium PtaU1.Bin034]|nr:MAG: High-affinity zinc uptake system binding-protein ZnuA precursor [Syntrophorhabdaceae bacterium PtaU1.Bin034]
MRRTSSRFYLLLFVLLVLAGGFLSCQRTPEPSQKKRLQVVTTLFPLYDFARNVGGDKAEVGLLLPPGVEPHSFEPKPRDIVRVNQADIFVFTGNFMEPWAAALLKGADRQKLVVVDSSRGIALRPEAETEEPDSHAGKNHHKHVHSDAIDPHIWLDFGNAQKMVDNILEGFITKDPQNRAFYEKNAAAYKARLRDLDDHFKEGLQNCETRLFVHGGHYAFNYLAQRYNLSYVSVYGFSPNAEPSPAHLVDIVQKIRRYRIKYVFYEELLQPRVADTIARETGAGLLPLNGGHNVTKEELERGVTFISLMEQDLKNLRTGLQCR